MVGGSVVLALCLLAIATPNSAPVLIGTWFAAQLATNAAFAAHLATVADQIPPTQTATVTALAGVRQTVGILVAIYLTSALTSDTIGLFPIPAAIGVAVMLAHALVLPDQPLPRSRWMPEAACRQ